MEETRKVRHHGVSETEVAVPLRLNLSETLE